MAEFKITAVCTVTDPRERQKAVEPGFQVIARFASTGKSHGAGAISQADRAIRWRRPNCCGRIVAVLQGTTQVMDDLYASLDVETRIVVQQRTSEIKTLMRSKAQDIVEIGPKLIEVRDRLGHGRFDAWLYVEFEWSLQTAKRSMNVAQRFQNQQFVDFDMAPSAPYLLTAPSAPECAREEALLRAEEGEQITHRVAQEIIAAHKAMPSFTEQEPVTRLPGLGHAERKPSTDGGSVASVQRHPPATLAWDTPELAPTTRAVAGESVEANHKMAVHFRARPKTTSHIDN